MAWLCPICLTVVTIVHFSDILWNIMISALACALFILIGGYKTVSAMSQNLALFLYICVYNLLGIFCLLFCSCHHPVLKLAIQCWFWLFNIVRKCQEVDMCVVNREYKTIVIHTDYRQSTTTNLHYVWIYCVLVAQWERVNTRAITIIQFTEKSMDSARWHTLRALPWLRLTWNSSVS